jgi:membrane protein implicated in regulation of membrane protease activity
MVIWLLIGTGLCLVEVIFPTAFVACVLGISALLVAIVAPLIPVNLQIALWVGLSLLLVWMSRRFVRRTRTGNHLDATEAETLTEITTGSGGRVLYEGNSWAACCEDEGLTIGPNQPVYVVGRRGTTLLVIPKQVLKAGD